MKAIILAAGRGLRMGCFTNDKPKCLLEINGKSVLSRQLEVLDKKCNKISIVVGYRKEMIMNEVGSKYNYIENKDYRNTNSIYSLWLAKSELNDNIILINSDVVFNDKLINNLIESPYDICVALSTEWSLEKGYKVEIFGDRIVKMSMDIPENKIYGEYAGIIKINKRQLFLVKRYLSRLVNQNKDYWFEDVFSCMAQEGVIINYFNVDPFDWYEIDTIEEYNVLNKAFCRLDK